MHRRLLLILCGLTIACSSPTPLPEIAADTPEPPATASADAVTTVSSAAPSATPLPKPTPAPHKVGQNIISPGFKLPNKLQARAVTGVGDEMFIVTNTHNVAAGEVARIKRTGDQLTHKGPGYDHVWIHSYKIGKKSVAVATGQMGAVAVYQRGIWDYRLAPALEGEKIGVAHVTKTGHVYAAGDTHALYLRKGDAWTTYRYGMATAPRIIDIAVDKNGTVILLGAAGFVMSFSGGSFSNLTIQGMATGTLKKPLIASWSDPGASTFWAASDDVIAEINYKTKKATLHKTKLFFDPKSIHGAKTKKGTLLAISTFGKVALFDGKDFTAISSEGAEAVWLDGGKAEAYCATTFKGVVAFSVKHPWLGTGKGKPVK